MSSPTKSRTPLLAAVGVLVVAVLAVVLSVVLINKDDDGTEDKGATAGKSSPPVRKVDTAALPAAVTPDGLIRVGRAEAPVTVTVYEDFRCPYCQKFEKNMGPLLADYAEAGKVKVEYHLASFLDGKLGGTGSAKAANAARCSVDAGKFAAYHEALYAAQPDESEDGYTDAKLLELAGQVPGLRGAAFDACVTGQAQQSWVTAAQASFEAAGVQGTPSVKVDGKDVSQEISTVDALRAYIDARLGGTQNA